MKPSTESAPYRALRDRWEEKRNEAIRVFRHRRAAQVIKVLLAELEAMRLAEVSREVSIREAAALSGYNESSMWRLLREDVPNVGEPGHTRIRVGDLPLKPRRGDGDAEAGTVPPQSPEIGSRLGSSKLEIVNG